MAKLYGTEGETGKGKALTGDVETRGAARLEVALGRRTGTMRGRSGGRPAGRSDVVASGEVLGRRRRGDPATARDQWRIRATRARCRWDEAAARNAGGIGRGGASCPAQIGQRGGEERGGVGKSEQKLIEWG